MSIYKKNNEEAKLYAIENFNQNIEILKNNDVNVYNINLECDRFPFENESIDIVHSNQVLEHTKEFFWIMHETSRVLKVGGHIVMGVPNLAAWHNRIYLLLGIQPACIKVASAHVRGFTKSGLIKGINKVFPQGYELKCFKGSNFYPFSPKVANYLSELFPNLSTTIFFVFQKKKEYKNEFILYPQNNHLSTNYFIG